MTPPDVPGTTSESEPPLSTSDAGSEPRPPALYPNNSRGELAQTKTKLVSDLEGTETAIRSTSDPEGTETAIRSTSDPEGVKESSRGQVPQNKSRLAGRDAALGKPTSASSLPLQGGGQGGGRAIELDDLQTEQSVSRTPPLYRKGQGTESSFPDDLRTSENPDLSARLTTSTTPNSSHLTPKRWPTPLAMLLAGFLPATTARRTATVNLRTAFLFHILAVLFGAAEILAIMSVDSTLSYLYSDNALAFWFLRFSELVEDVLGLNGQNPVMTVLKILLIAAAVEVVFVVLAFMLMAWGAQVHDRLRDSFRNALMQLWLHTGHLCFAIALFGAGYVYDQLAPEPIGNSYPGVLDEGDQRTLAIVLGGISLNVIWLCWGTLRGMASRPHPKQSRNAPICESCGYNLSATPSDSKCPECGRLAQDSLSPIVRSGTPWQNKSQRVFISRWFVTAIQSVFRPTQLGKQLRLVPDHQSHRSFLVLHLLLVFFVTVTSFIAVFVAIESWSSFAKESPGFCLAMMVPGCIAVAGTFVLTILAATLAGIYQSLKAKRNVLPGSIQIACYQSPFLVAWLPIGVANFGLITYFVKIGFLQELAILMRTPEPVLAFFFWIIPSATFWFIYLALVFRGTSAMKYANR